MKRIRIENLQTEDYYNGVGYAEHLKNIHFHHSDKGCKCEMFIKYTNQKGEASLPMIAKRCLTHNVECYKEGFEFGFFGGTDSRAYCKDCGCRMKTRNSAMRCPDCQKKLNELRKTEWEKNHKHRVFKNCQNNLTNNKPLTNKASE